MIEDWLLQDTGAEARTAVNRILRRNVLGDMVLVVLAVALLVVSKIIWKKLCCCGSKNVTSKNISGSGSNTKKNNCGSNHSSDSDVTW
jgi:hypothetical protein